MHSDFAGVNKTHKKSKVLWMTKPRTAPPNYKKLKPELFILSAAKTREKLTKQQGSAIQIEKQEIFFYYTKGYSACWSSKILSLQKPTNAAEATINEYKIQRKQSNLNPPRKTLHTYNFKNNLDSEYKSQGGNFQIPWSHSL